LYQSVGKEEMKGEKKEEEKRMYSSKAKSIVEE